MCVVASGYLQSAEIIIISFTLVLINHYHHHIIITLYNFNVILQ